MGSKLDPEIKRWRAIEPNRHLIWTPYPEILQSATPVKTKKYPRIQRLRRKDYQVGIFCQIGSDFIGIARDARLAGTPAWAWSCCARWTVDGCGSGQTHSAPERAQAVRPDLSSDLDNAHQVGACGALATAAARKALACSGATCSKITARCCSLA